VLVGIYTLVWAIIILVRLQSLKNQGLTGTQSLESSLARLEARSASLGQLLNAAFYSVGFFFFATLPWAFFPRGDSSVPASTLIMHDFIRYFTVARTAFLVFLVVHSVQWFVSSRVRAARLRLLASNQHIQS
jgi:hypothetical protein